MPLVELATVKGGRSSGRALKLRDKLAALQQLGQSLQMFTDKVELSLDDAIIAKLHEGRKRVADAK
jgi:hypothetical protein